MKVFRFGIATAFLILNVSWQQWAMGALLPSAPVPAVSVVTTEGVELLSVTTQAASLSVILAEIAHRAGFTIIGTVSTERIVSIEFTAAPLDQALGSLLRDENFIFLFRQLVEGGPEELQQIIFLGSKRPAAHFTDEPHMVAVPEGADAFDPDGPLESLLSLTTHPDSRMRTAALEALTRHTGDERAHQTLMEHLSDLDPHIRTVALGLLGPFVTQWSGAEEAVIAALEDPAPQVRQLALLTLSETAGFNAREALHKALHDADPGVRTRAEELLRDMISENSDHDSSTAGSRNHRTE